MIGDKDITAIGKDLAPPAGARNARPLPGAWPRRRPTRYPGATLVEFATLGHAPQMQDPAAFHAALLDGLAGRLPPRSVR